MIIMISENLSGILWKMMNNFWFEKKFFAALISPAKPYPICFRYCMDFVIFTVGKFIRMWFLKRTFDHLVDLNVYFL